MKPRAAPETRTEPAKDARADQGLTFRRSHLAGYLLAAGLVLGCGSIDPADHQPGSGGDAGSGGEGGSAESPGPVGELLPWAVGNTWTYDVTKDGVLTPKTTTIGDTELVGGTGPNADVMAYHVTTAKGADENDHTESWQAPDEGNPARILRYREQSFSAMTGNLQLDEHWDPAKLHVDGSADHTPKGASWLEQYSETKLEVGLPATAHEARDRWTVLDDDEALEVPAGSFEHVIHFQKAGSGSTKDYWYLRGVGKLKETGAQTEELTEYKLQEATP